MKGGKSGNYKVLVTFLPDIFYCDNPLRETSHITKSRIDIMSYMSPFIQNFDINFASFLESRHNNDISRLDSGFNMANNYFILAETLIIIAFVTSQSSSICNTVHNLLYVGLVFSILWLLINCQYFARYTSLHNKFVEEIRKIIPQNINPYAEINFQGYWKNDLTFWTFIITPLAFIGIYGLLLLN